jgi:hypothetical protein
MLGPRKAAPCLGGGDDQDRGEQENRRAFFCWVARRGVSVSDRKRFNDDYRRFVENDGKDCGYEKPSIAWEQGLGRDADWMLACGKVGGTSPACNAAPGS